MTSTWSSRFAITSAKTWGSSVHIGAGHRVLLLLGPLQRHRHDSRFVFDAQRLHRFRLLVFGARRTGRPGRRYGSAVGFNPFRKQVNRRSDIVFVGAALVIAAVLVIWAALPASATVT